MPDHYPPCDLLIVGSGIMGSCVARLAREQNPGLRIVMVEGGSAIGRVPGRHLHDVAEPELWERYNERVSSGIQGFYAGAARPVSDAADIRRLEPGLHVFESLGDQASAMPMAAAAWNVGGMGAHWTAAVPWPAGSEVFDFGDPDRFDHELRMAQRILGSRAPAIGPTVPGQLVLDALTAQFAHVGTPTRGPQPMPMAVFPEGQMLRRVGPEVIFPPLGGAPDARFRLMDGHLATQIVHDGDHVTGVKLRRVNDGEEVMATGSAIVVCADAFRTPQLLQASGVRPAALGRYLNEHAFLTGQVLMDLDRFGLDLAGLPRTRPGEFAVDSLWLPHNGPNQPLHGQIMNSTYVDEDGVPLAYGVGVSLYSPVEIRSQNRIRFIDGETDLAGLPRFEIEYAYTALDRELIDTARATLQAIAANFGPFDPQRDSALLPPGSSLHQTGTVRMGATDDGTSVCDRDCRVWGFDNLFLAGNGVVPTAVVANATLTGAVTAVRAATAAARHLDYADH